MIAPQPRAGDILLMSKAALRERAAELLAAEAEYVETMADLLALCRDALAQLEMTAGFSEFPDTLIQGLRAAVAKAEDRA